MKDFICKKCGNNLYTMQEKLNGTGKALELYCAKCGTRHKWPNKQEKVTYTTVDSDKDKEIIRLTTELEKYKRALYILAKVFVELKGYEPFEVSQLAKEITIPEFLQEAEREIEEEQE